MKKNPGLSNSSGCRSYYATLAKPRHGQIRTSWDIRQMWGSCRLASVPFAVNFSYFLACVWNPDLFEHMSQRSNRFSSLCVVLAARVGRKRGKMNLEKSINKNMFDLSSAIRDANPLAPSDRLKLEHAEQHDSPASTARPSMLSNSKQRIAAQFKRAITMITQRHNPTADPLSLQASPFQSRMLSKSIDPKMVTDLIGESKSAHQKQGNEGSLRSSPSMVTPKSQSLVPGRSQPVRSVSNQILARIDASPNHPSTTTVLTMDSPSIRITRPNSPSMRNVKQNLQQIHSSILQTINQQSSLSPPTTTLSATPTSSSSTTTGTNEVMILETIL